MRALLAVPLVLLGCDPGTHAGGVPDSAAPASSSPPIVAPSAAAAPDPSVAETTPPDSVIAQHILVAYKGAKRAPKNVTRSKADARTRTQEAIGKIRAGMSFEDAVKEYSDDAGSLDRMGSVGKFRRDAMDPAFSAAAFALKVGDVSDPVETPFGFHLIKRTQ